jgi:hypothetical protein
MACSTYTVLFQGRSIARAFVSPDANDTQHLGSVIRIERSGQWEDNTLEIHFCDMQSDSFPSDMPELDIVNQLLAGAAIEPGKCVVVKNT